MSQQTITEAQKTTIEETVRALTDAVIAAAEQVDVDGIFDPFVLIALNCFYQRVNCLPLGVFSESFCGINPHLAILVI